MTTNLLEDDWVPSSCTLPTVEQPLRRQEFDDLFARDLGEVVQESPRRVRLQLHPDPAAAARAADLATRETGCCGFFTFRLTVAHGEVALEVETAAGHEEVLAALAARAESRRTTAAS